MKLDADEFLTCSAGWCACGLPAELDLCISQSDLSHGILCASVPFDTESHAVLPRSHYSLLGAPHLFVHLGIVMFQIMTLSSLFASWFVTTCLKNLLENRCASTARPISHAWRGDYQRLCPYVFFLGGGIGDCYDTRVFIFILLKGVAPSSFVRPPHQHIETCPEDTAHSPTVCDHPDGRGDPHAMQQGLPSHVDTQTVAVSDNGAVHHGSSTHAPAGHHVLFCIARQPVFDTLPANNLDIMNIHCPFCGALHWLDERVSSSRAGHPQFGTCCAHGKVKLPFLRVPPAPLYNLYTGDTPQAKEFQANIMQYNAALAFTSLGVKVDRSVVGLAFGGFIDRIRRDRNVNKPISSMEIEIANIAYISNRPEPSPNREHPTIKFWSTHETHTTAYRIQHSSNNIANTMEL